MDDVTLRTGVTYARERAPLGRTYVPFHGMFAEMADELGRVNNPDLIAYATMERQGRATWFVARWRDLPVGFLSVIHYNSLHSGERIGHDDLLFVRPEWRGLGIAPRLLHMGHDWLAQQGCDLIENIARRGSYLRTLGFEKRAEQWVRPCRK